MKRTITILTCDECEKEVPSGTGAQVRMTPADPRKDPKEADLCDSCFDEHAGTKAARRGRKPGSKTPAQALVAV